MANRFENGKIYRLLCDDGHYYIGSTTNELQYRLAGHKGVTISNQKVYKYINAIGWDHVIIELVETCACNNREELLEREDYYICLGADDPLNLNMRRAHMTLDEKKEYDKEYYELNKEYITQVNKEYYETHTEDIIEQHKDYIEQNKEKADQYQADYRLINAEKRREYSKNYAKEHPEANLEYMKNYYEENKDKIKETNKKYVEANKELVAERKRIWSEKRKEIMRAQREETQEGRLKIKAQHKLDKKATDEQVIMCECGGSYQPYRKSRHDSSKKHQKFIEI